MEYEPNGKTQPAAGKPYPKPPNTKEGVKLGGPVHTGGMDESHGAKE